MTKEQTLNEVKGLKIALDLASNAIIEEDIKEIAEVILRATERVTRKIM